MRSSGVYFSELALKFRVIASARGSLAFAVLFLATQAAVTLAGGHDRIAWVYETFGLSGVGISSGKIWQFWTYGLLHGGFLHAGVNAFSILVIGARVEHVLGKSWVWKTMILGFFGGGLAHILTVSGDESGLILVGASGGCVGLLILLTTLSPESRMWPLPVSARNLGIGVMATELILALTDPKVAVPGFSRIGEWLTEQGLGNLFTIGHACHFGGGLAGFLAGRWLLRPRVSAARLRRARERREAREIRRI